MSKFKLDFDISTPARRLVPRVVARCPSEAPKSRSSSQTSETENQPLPPETKNADRDDASTSRATSEEARDSDNKSTQKGTRIPLFLVKLILLGVLLVTSTFLLAPPARVELPRTTRRRCTTLSQPVHAVVCYNHCRRLGHTECVAEFETDICAEQVQSVHFHYADGSTRRVPAMYQRLSNSTMFALEGNRAVFQPTRCKAKTSAVLVRSVSESAYQLLQSHVVWIAPRTSKSFRVVRNGVHVLAEVSAGFVLDKCASRESRLCVYKIETRCEGHVSTQVIVVAEDGTESHAETFVYCD